jgi:mycothiol synthase
MSQLAMEIAPLHQLVAVRPPDGYTLRDFRAGDQVALSRIFSEGKLGLDTPEAVEHELLGAQAFAPRRTFVIEYEGDVVATASAWTNADDPEHAYLHMLAVLESHRGQRLGVVLSIATAIHARSKGFVSQRLLTDEWRESAIVLYLDLGFYPLYLDPTHPRRWKMVAAKLHRPELLEKARQGRIGRRPSMLARVRRLAVRAASRAFAQL